MVKRKLDTTTEEPEQITFKMPSEKEHLFQVVDVFDNTYQGNKFNLDLDTVMAKLEVVGGDEEGRSILNRLSLDPEWKGFFATRQFLKAIGESYKGEIDIDTDEWIGRQFYATVIHNPANNGKVYANIEVYNYEKMITQERKPKTETQAHEEEAEVAWDSI